MQKSSDSPKTSAEVEAKWKAEDYKSRELYCEALERGEVMFRERHHGRMVTFCEKLENCVKVGSFMWKGKERPTYIPKIDYCMKHMGANAVIAAIKEITGGKSLAELMGDKLWVISYRKKLDELVATVQYTLSNRD